MSTHQLPPRRILFTPGPLTTSATVKQGLLCEDQSPRDIRFMTLLREVREKIAKVVSHSPRYQTALLSCSGTGAVESMLLAAARSNKPLLIINNGAYGKRMCEIARAYEIPFQVIEFSPLQKIELSVVEQAISAGDSQFSALAVVHHETTTGLLNNIESLGKLCKQYQIPFVVDAMSSYAALNIDMQRMNIQLLASSSNKNLQGMPGVGIVILDTEYVQTLLNFSTKCFYLDCIAEWAAQENTGQGRFTLPVQIIKALAVALNELDVETCSKRLQRYQNNWNILTDELKLLGFTFLLPENLQSRLIVSVIEPDNKNLSFKTISEYMTNRGIDIYPGKLPSHNYFRLCTVGDLYEKDMYVFVSELKNLISQKATYMESV